MKNILKYTATIIGIVLMLFGIPTFVVHSTPQTVSLVLNVGLIIMSIFMCFFVKVMIIDSIRFSGTFHKRILYERKEANTESKYYIQTPFRKIPLSKIYNEKNPYTLMLQEGGYYKNGIIDKDGGFIIPLWSLYQTANGYIPDKEILKCDEYLNSESLWKFLTK